MMELLFLLLPLAAAMGWFSGRRGKFIDLIPREHNPAYFKGLNLLLNEQQDKAVDAFIEMLEVDSDTVETHLALGSLFRRKGETDRAIRIHQNLIAKPSLSKQQRAQALLELGQDYMRAGLYDRAEGLFDELLTHKYFQVPALSNLLLIYQQEREWEQCLVAAGRLEALGEPSLRVERSHYLCELAQQAMDARNESQAETYLKKALSADRHSVRASMLMGEMQQQRGNYVTAFRTYRRIANQDADFLGQVIPLLKECAAPAGEQDTYREILEQSAYKDGNIDAMMALIDIVLKEDGDKVATEIISSFLERHPSLQGLEKMLAVRLQEGGDEVDPMLLRLNDLISQMLDASYSHRCTQCGYWARRLHWYCPSCRSWSTIRPYSASENYAPTGKSLLEKKIS